MLAKGEIHLVALSMLQPLLTSENHERLLRKACRRTKREVEAMVAGMLPAAPEPRDRVRALPPPLAPGPAFAMENPTGGGELFEAGSANEAVVAPAPAPNPAPKEIVSAWAQIPPDSEGGEG